MISVQPCIRVLLASQSGSQLANYYSTLKWCVSSGWRWRRAWCRWWPRELWPLTCGQWPWKKVKAPSMTWCPSSATNTAHSSVHTSWSTFKTFLAVHLSLCSHVSFETRLNCLISVALQSHSPPAGGVSVSRRPEAELRCCNGGSC